MAIMPAGGSKVAIEAKSLGAYDRVGAGTERKHAEREDEDSA